MRSLLLIIMIIALSACAKKQVKVPKPLARVYSHYLYRSDLEGVVPKGLSADDSIKVIGDFIERWVRKQLLLNQAELNLTDQEKNVEQQIESYRSSLLIYAYEQSYIRQKLDTVVTDKEIEDYYKQNQSNFILNGALMKGVFVKVHAKTPDQYKLRQWIRYETPDNLKNLEAYCYKNAVTYDHFNDQWITLNEVLSMIPPRNGGWESSVIYRKYIETTDSTFNYYLYAKDVIPSGNLAPLETVKNDIQSIILNKRKIDLINKLEANIYNDAQNRDQFTIYP